MPDFPRPYPERDRDTTPFWEAQDQHELKFQRCTKCGVVRYLVGPLCPECHSFEHEWITSSGKGTVASYTVVRQQTHPAFPAPYTILLVEMEEGPRVVARLDAPAETPVEIGASVHVEWEDGDKQSLPVFVLDG